MIDKHPTAVTAPLFVYYKCNLNYYYDSNKPFPILSSQNKKPLITMFRPVFAHP